MSTNPPDFMNDAVAVGMLVAEALAAEPDGPVIDARRVAVLACDGVDDAHIAVVQRALEAAGAHVNILSNRSGFLQSLGGGKVRIDGHWLDMPSLMFDAVYVPGGEESLSAMRADPDVLHFVQEAYEHGKALAATSHGVDLLRNVGVSLPTHEGGFSCPGVVTDCQGSSLGELSDRFIEAIVKDRHWRRTEDPVSPLH